MQNAMPKARLMSTFAVLMVAAALTVTGCSKKTEQAAADGNPQAAANAAGQDIKDNAAQAAQATASAAQVGAAVATGAAMNAGDAIASAANTATATADANIATANADNNAAVATANSNDIPEKQRY